jgi:hypothetical protein
MTANRPSPQGAIPALTAALALVQPAPQSVSDSRAHGDFQALTANPALCADCLGCLFPQFTLGPELTLSGEKQHSDLAVTSGVSFPAHFRTFHLALRAL